MHEGPLNLYRKHQRFAQGHVKQEGQKSGSQSAWAKRKSWENHANLGPRVSQRPFSSTNTLARCQPRLLFRDVVAQEAHAIRRHLLSQPLHGQNERHQALEVAFTALSDLTFAQIPSSQGSTGSTPFCLNLLTCSASLSNSFTRQLNLRSSCWHLPCSSTSSGLLTESSASRRHRRCSAPRACSSSCAEAPRSSPRRSRSASAADRWPSCASRCSESRCRCLAQCSTSSEARCRRSPNSPRGAEEGIRWKRKPKRMKAIEIYRKMDATPSQPRSTSCFAPSAPFLGAAKSLHLHSPGIHTTMIDAYYQCLPPCPTLGII